MPVLHTPRLTLTPVDWSTYEAIFATSVFQIYLFWRIGKENKKAYQQKLQAETLV